MSRDKEVRLNKPVESRSRKRNNSGVCFLCKQKGHFQKQCPDTKQRERLYKTGKSRSKCRSKISSKRENKFFEHHDLTLRLEVELKTSNVMSPQPCKNVEIFKGRNSTNKR